MIISSVTPSLLRTALMLIFASNAIAQLQTIRQQHETVGVFEPNDRFGSSVASGDFNNDGFGDVAAGAPNETIGESSLTSGLVAINYGGPLGVRWTSKQQLLPGISADVKFGASLAAADFNGDGFDDLAVGAPGFHFDGRVYVYYGSSVGLNSEVTPDIFDVTNFGFSLDGFDYFGETMAAGKLAGDDFADLAIGAHGFDPSGAVFVLKGSAGGLTTSGGSTIDGATLPTPVSTNGSFGRAIAFGDLAGFDFEDLVIGSPGAVVDGQSLNGMIHIIPVQTDQPIYHLQRRSLTYGRMPIPLTSKPKLIPLARPLPLENLPETTTLICWPLARRVWIRAAAMS